ncbi:hypothetical protein BpHYR1_030978 [Brachionus plicatilis]|uniref:Uncharacterized protein n=1 Tax=Brachionus plicatilis TaxID=10195 RepID=A0A3M7SW65_BRAPC|nr:hypothetical protein BpHYR1_030978 [Brachionus plicatilis]
MHLLNITKKFQFVLSWQANFANRQDGILERIFERDQEQKNDLFRAEVAGTSSRSLSSVE